MSKRGNWLGVKLGRAEIRPEQIPSLRFCPPSAGIGRTGVLVTMETAMCLIERNLPVYPLDIVRKMRDQRAMMVQTSVSRKPFDKSSNDGRRLLSPCRGLDLPKGFAGQETKATELVSG